MKKVFLTLAKISGVIVLVAGGLAFIKKIISDKKCNESK